MKVYFESKSSKNKVSKNDSIQSTTYDPATSAEQVDAQSTEAHSTSAFDYQDPEPLYYEDIIDETHPLPRENDPKWRIFRFSDIEAEINGDHDFDRDLDTSLKLNKVTGFLLHKL